MTQVAAAAAFDVLMISIPAACIADINSQKDAVKHYLSKGNLLLQGRPPLLLQPPLRRPWWRQSLRQMQTSLLPARYCVCLQTCPAPASVAWHAFCKHIASGRLLTTSPHTHCLTIESKVFLAGPLMLCLPHTWWEYCVDP